VADATELTSRPLLALDAVTDACSVAVHDGDRVFCRFAVMPRQHAARMLPLIDEVLEEVPRVRAELGYPPLVTPMSQIVGTQAVANVVTGERYKMVPSEVRSYVKGHYGKPPQEIEDEIKKKIIGDDEVVTQRPADLLKPGLEKGYKEIAHYMQKEEDLLSYLLFPPVALKYLRERLSSTYGVDFGLIESYDEEPNPGWYPI